MSYRSQAEETIKDYLEALVSVPVYTGTSDQVKGMPCVVVAFTGGTENPPRTGNMDLSVEISISSEVGEEAQPGAMATHDEIVDAIEEAIIYADLMAINQTSTDLHIFGINEISGIERDTDGSILTERITFTMAAALGDF
jgi:hypothetical protein